MVLVCLTRRQLLCVRYALIHLNAERSERLVNVLLTIKYPLCLMTNLNGQEYTLNIFFKKRGSYEDITRKEEFITRRCSRRRF